MTSPQDAKPAVLKPTWRQLGQRLYIRIWLAVVLTVAVLTLLMGWVWRLTAEAPLRELHVRNKEGEIIGSAQRRVARIAAPDDDAATHAPPDQGSPPPSMPDRNMPLGVALDSSHGTMHNPVPSALDKDFGRGPEFLVTLKDGQVLHIHLPRPADHAPFGRRPYGFFWMLGMVGLAVALGTYPIVRRLTKRLEALQQGVEQWGNGDLTVRVALQGHDEVGFLATRFNHAASQIETLLKSHKSLLANASHELRSPLTRIRMGLELMGSAPSDAFKSEIKRNIAELDQLIDEILLSSRLDVKESDMGTVESVDLTGLVAEECARHDALFNVHTSETSDASEEARSDSGDSMDNDREAKPILVRGVVKLLRRVVRNLLENARRYSQGDIVVTLRLEGDRAVLWVADQGPGVPATLRERIFEPFYRLPGASEHSGGVGLGLALVKSITERMGGTVLCEDNDGRGARFVVTLPRLDPA